MDELLLRVSVSSSTRNGLRDVDVDVDVGGERAASRSRCRRKNLVREAVVMPKLLHKYGNMDMT